MSCNLYKIPQAVTPVTIIYADCDGIDQLVAVPVGADYYFCSTNLISVPEGIVEISICHTPTCDCYSIEANQTYEITYLDCDDNVISIAGVSESKISFCAKAILYDSTGVVSKGYPCINGLCIVSPPPTTPLLYTLLKLRGPCPDICNGTTKLGGLTGTDDVNIITQNPL